MTKTELILKYCRIADGPHRKYHADWCEAITGLWHTCDCGLSDHFLEKIFLLMQIDGIG